MEGNITLYELLNLSIGFGTHQKGTVNFSALYALLLAILKQLDIREIKIRWGSSPPGDTEPDASVEVPAPDRQTAEEEEKEEVHRNLSESDQQVQLGPELQNQVNFDGSPDDKERLRSRIQTCEDEVSKVTEFVTELQKQNNDLRKKIEELHQLQKTAGSDTETPTEVEKGCHGVDALQNAVELTNTNVLDPTGSVEPTDNPPTEPPHPPPSSSPLPEEHDATAGAPSSQNVSDLKFSPQEAEDTAKALSILPGPQIQADPHQTPGPTAADMDPSHKANSSAWYQETVEAVRSISKLKERFIQLEAHMAILEEQKVDQNQLAQLRELISNKDSHDGSNNLTEPLNQQRALLENLMSDQEKRLDNLEEMLENLMSLDRGTSSEGVSESLDIDSKAFYELRQQVLYFSKSFQKLEEDLKHLRAQQALMEERASDRHLQDQLDDLRGMFEDMMLSPTSQVSSSLQDESESTQTADSTANIGELSLLIRHYEQLQDRVNGLILQQNRDRTEPQQDGQAARNLELVYDVQRASLKLQADCEKLQETTRSLHENDRRKQEHIEELYKLTKELEGKKADKLMVEKEMNADKSALESKVSRLQFDLATEQLNSMFHELLNKVTGQEQEWHKVTDRLSTEMERKLNRIELESVKKQLEDRWRSIQERLQSQSAPDDEDAAGTRKQLVERFHCLSCDKPILKHASGPVLDTLPSSPAFPSHKFISPFSMEQLRLRYRNKQISELADYPVVPRSCGGSHTNTSVSQRRSALQQTKLLPQMECDGVNQLQEVSIVGLDGHIYRGCLNVQTLKNTETKLPIITTKEDMCKNKDKAKSSTSQRPALSPVVGHESPVHQHPPSAKSTQCSRSASSCSGRDWPVSALGCCTSQSSISQVSAAAENTADPQGDGR